VAASRLALLGRVTVVSVLALMTLGNVVSATGSGLACPDWPLCHGRLVPPLQADVLIEWGHRLAAAVTSVLLVVTIVLCMRRAAGTAARRVGAALLVLLAGQIALGGVTVLLRLPHLVSTAHLVNALLILAGLLLLVRQASPGPAPSGPVPASLGWLARAGMGALLLQLAIGGYVRHTGAGLACPDFPLCSGDILPGHWLAVAHWTHRWLGVALLGLFVHSGLRGRGTPLAGLTGAAAALAGLQVALGIATVLLRLSPPVRAAHAAVGYLLWALLVWIAIQAADARGGARERARAGARPARAEAADAV
jgi:heme A synthase